MKNPLTIFSIILLVCGGAYFGFWATSNNSMAEKDLPYDGNDPDMPKFFSNLKEQIGREEFIKRRSEFIGMKRGIYKDTPFDPTLRPKAIKEMDKKLDALAKMPESSLRDSLLAPWNPIGPAPIPNGQTTNTSVPVSGRTISIAIHPTNPDIVYVGTAQGGLYRTTDGGTNWTPLMDNALSLAIGTIAIAPSQPDTIYVGTGEPNSSNDSYYGVGIYRIDNASSGSPVLTGPFGPFTGRSVSKIVVHPTNPAFIFASSTFGLGGIIPNFPNVADDANLYRSTDATSANPTFFKFFNGNINFRDFAIDPTDPNILIANPPFDGIIRITNATGAFSSSVVIPFNGEAEIASQRSGGDTNATFYVASGINQGRVYRSTDGGLNWTIQSTTGFCGGQCFYNLAIDVDQTNANNVFVGGQAATQGAITSRSTDGGVNFTAINDKLHADTHAIAVSPSNPLIVYTGNDGGIFKSVDGGINYDSLNNSQFSATQFMSVDVHPTDPIFSIGGTQDNGTNFLQPAGTWTHADFGDGGYALIDQNAPDNVNVRMYHTYFNSVNSLLGYATVPNVTLATDGNWSFRGCGGTPNNGINCNDTAVNFYAPLERGPGNPNTIYYGSDRLYRSADSGLNHTVVSQAPIVSGVPISAIGISPQNDNIRLVGLNNGGIYGTSTGATSLQDLDPSNNVPNVPIARAVIDPSNPSVAYVSLSAYGVPSVWKTTNLNTLADNGSATTWTNASGTGGNVLPQVAVSAFVVDPMLPNNIYAGTDIGVYVSTDGGTNWSPLGTGLPRVAVFDMAITNAAPRQVRIATHGRGLYQTPALVAPTAAEVSVSGRTLTSNGRVIARATISITDGEGQVRTTNTNQFGYYRFDNVPVGNAYTFTAAHKQYRFEPRIVSISEDISGFDFTSLP